MSEASATIDDLLTRDPSRETGEQILTWFADLNGRIARGDLMIGILDIDEVEKAPKALAHAAAGGLDVAQLLLARWLIAPLIGDPDHEAALEALGHAVDAKVPGAALSLASFQWFYRRETATEDERSQASSLVRQLVDEDPEDVDALYLLGLLTTGGFGCAPDPTAGFELQKRAAEAGSTSAKFELYVHLITGSGVEQDEAAAFEYTKAAAAEGHPRALYNLGAAYARGSMVGKDMAKAAQYYQAACDEGNGQACATLAAMYFLGDGVPQDTSEAEELFSAAEYEGFDPTAIKTAIGWTEDD